jgi:hypothetical protein
MDDKAKVGSTGGDPGAAERGRAANVRPDGEVHGSGSGAGGGGTPEDIDSDPMAGGEGDLEPRDPPPAGVGADAPSHGSR